MAQNVPIAPTRTHEGLQLYARYALAGSLCASSAHMILVPIDVVKTRMQVRLRSRDGVADVPPAVFCAFFLC